MEKGVEELFQAKNAVKVTRNKVSDRYNLCRDLCMLTLEEAERLAWDIFILDEQGSIEHKLNEYKHKPDVLCVWLSNHFKAYVMTTVHSSTDSRRVYLFNFILET